MKWLHIKSDTDKDTVINLENVSSVSIHKSSHTESVASDSDSNENWIIEAILGNCVILLHQSPRVKLRAGVEADKKKAIEYEQKCKHFYRDLMSYICQNDTPDSWEVRKVMFAPDYTSSKM